MKQAKKIEYINFLLIPWSIQKTTTGGTTLDIFIVLPSLPLQYWFSHPVSPICLWIVSHLHLIHFLWTSNVLYRHTHPFPFNLMINLLKWIKTTDVLQSYFIWKFNKKDWFRMYVLRNVSDLVVCPTRRKNMFEH